MLKTTEQRLTAIRQWLKDKDIDALLVPHEDEYLGEYVPAHNERLFWLTGFTGSAGAAASQRIRQPFLSTVVILYK